MNQTETVQGGEFATGELALATFLVMQGYLFEMREEGVNPGNNHPIGTWVFRDTDGELANHIRAFNDGEARVDPARFERTMGDTRRALFAFLKIPTPQRGKRRRSVT